MDEFKAHELFAELTTLEHAIAELIDRCYQLRLEKLEPPVTVEPLKSYRDYMIARHDCLGIVLIPHGSVVCYVPVEPPKEPRANQIL